ncbi:3-dehydroquinate synthase [Neobacillus vireti]|uniref:3-dehydroquinate synthase n=1 Tax=Neobacillus vireti LMG 21834 TaxID=1131730 RepID=A0AB94IH91_9BACI|nr:3-dehydroquinate synthase [Neobacillus vireti]ETI66484.1 3-dehydroquinate synthase [Neobacillus vireti LMG 21834]KLT17168.1 3-dehydroquinate synthase [Neobacillus vireti]
MDTIHIQTESKNYNVFVGKGVRSELGTFLANHFPDLTRILIITDETVAKLHLEKLQLVLKSWEPIIYTGPSGEKTKTFEVYYDALSSALENHLDRKSVIVAFGGGAVGDLSGFVASSYMRGIPFIQVPTTILAHDSAVGGKVAINHPLGKNMIGAFYQPEAVFYDLELLTSLPEHEIRSGFAEVIKHALISDPSFYEWLRKNVDDLNLISLDQLSYSIVKGIKIKNEFVSQDERETGIRAYLNFGHTLGHAIESEMGYGNFTHGEAVMIGMIFALKLSEKLLDLSFDLEKFIEWVEHLGYKTKVPNHLSVEKLVAKMKQDKKSVGDSIRFVLLEQLGQPKLQKISETILLDELKRF